MEYKVNLICCEKEMIKINVYSPNDDIVRFFCGECGTFKDIRTYCLDDEILIDEIENYDLQNTKIAKELNEKEIK